jgi:hypothetical protein
MSVKEWLNESPGAKLDEEENIRKMQSNGSVAQNVMPFDPRTQVSADAKYIVSRLVIWFLIVPVVLGIVAWAVTR